MASMDGLCLNGKTASRILNRERAKGAHSFAVCSSMCQAELLMISRAGRRMSKPTIAYWGYDHETGYFAEKIARRHRWWRAGFIYWRRASHRRRTGWAGRSCGRSNVNRSPTRRSISTGVVPEAFVQELRRDGGDRIRFA